MKSEAKVVAAPNSCNPFIIGDCYPATKRLEEKPIRIDPVREEIQSRLSFACRSFIFLLVRSPSWPADSSVSRWSLYMSSRPPHLVKRSSISVRRRRANQVYIAVVLSYRGKLATKIASDWSLQISHKCWMIVKWLTKLLGATVSNSIRFSMNATRNAWTNINGFRLSPSFDPFPHPFPVHAQRETVSQMQTCENLNDISSA